MTLAGASTQISHRTLTRRVCERCLVLLGILALAAPLPAAAANPVVRGDIQPREASVGDVIRLTIEAESSPQVLFEPVEVKDTGPFELRSVSQPVKTAKDGVVVWRWLIELTIFQTGTHTLPALQLHYRTDPQAESSTVSTGTWEVKVETVLEDSANDILDIKQPLPMRRSLWSYWPWALLALPLMLLAWWWSRRRGRLGTSVIPHRPLLPPHEEALRALRDLETREYLEDGRYKAFYTLLSEILRRYLWRRFEIVALEATTSDIRSQLQSRGTQDPVVQRVDALLGRCDMVKFARVQPPGREGAASILEARQLIETTGPAQEVAGEPSPTPSAAGATP